MKLTTLVHLVRVLPALAGLLGVQALPACSQSAGAPTVPGASPPEASQGDSSAPTHIAIPAQLKAEPPPPTPVERIRAAPSLEAALKVAKPAFDDTFDSTSDGAKLFATWAVDNLRWSQLSNLEETKYALVMKDPDEERGKRLCGRGLLVEIQAERTAHGKVHHGGIALGYAKVLRFYAVGSTGKLVARKNARFCGVVVGKQSYRNSAGGTAHGLMLVGIFDLPANRDDLPSPKGTR